MPTRVNSCDDNLHEYVKSHRQNRNDRVSDINSQSSFYVLLLTMVRVSCGAAIIKMRRSLPLQ